MQVCAGADEEEDDEEEGLEFEDAELGGFVLSLWFCVIREWRRVVPLLRLDAGLRYWTTVSFLQADLGWVYLLLAPRREVQVVPV